MAEYSRRMRQQASWGGAIELTAFAHAMDVSVWVWQRRGGGALGFERTQAFDARGGDGVDNTVHLLFEGRRRGHYNSFFPDPEELVEVVS